MPITSSVSNIDQLVFPVCVGKSRMSKKWRNTTMTWSEIVARLSHTERTPETMEEYLAMSRDKQAETKDKGGVVCGHLKNDANSRQKDLAGRKTKDNILNRSILTFDIDDCPAGYNPIDVIIDQLPHVEAVAYTTHKHTKEHPRWRVFIPLSEWVTPFYYEAIARKIGSMIGMEHMDKTTFQYNRLMYWPSTPTDGEFLFDRAHGDAISPRGVLTEYPALKRESAWPRHPEEDPFPVQSPLTEREGEYNNVQRPVVATEKGGVVGAFLEAYPIEQAIATFLSSVYTPCGMGRYTYVNGSSEGGLVIYDNQFAYSNHATDPANNGHDNNAFDLVRIHMFGNLDAGTHKTGANLPSFRAMCDFALEDTNVKAIIAAQKKKELLEDFADLDFSDDDDEQAEQSTPSSSVATQSQPPQPEEPPTDWVKELQVDRKGKVTDCNPNQDLILLNDPVFKFIRYDAFHRYNLMQKPSLLKCSSPKLSDEMLRNIATRFYTAYGINMSVNRAAEALSGTQTRRAFNPVQDYIKSVEWDGEPRLDTMLIRYLGAEDNALNREQTRRWMIGAVRRAFKPGSKFDYMLVLTGPQGIGKSTLLRTIAADGDFFNESLQLDMRGKDLVEQLNSAWIFEIAELGGLRSLKETDKVKAFISVTTDIMRAPYAHTTESYPRHCALAASTNDTTFLSDSSSRKFWIIPVGGISTPPEQWQPQLSEEVPQLWAEAYAAYKAGEQNFLTAEYEQQAREIQATFNTVTEDPATGIVGAYLDYLLPSDWRSRSRDARRAYLQTYDVNDATQTLLRNRICSAEVRNEVKECMAYSSQYINKILTSLGWLRHPSQKANIDEAYGKQRNVFIRPDTDGSDTFTTRITEETNTPYRREYDDDEDL